MSDVFQAAPIVRVPVVGSADTFPVRRVYCVGRNYVEHALEMGATGREAPFFFLKPSDAVVPVGAGSVGEVAYPGMTTNYHHEVELVVAIGKAGREIPAIDAMGHVFGFAVGLDMTRRDLQNEMKRQGRPWCIGKGFDQSAPIGPITPAAQVRDFNGTRISLTVNEEPRQSSRIDKMIWNVAEIIAHVSLAWGLEPGDLIYTGTPEGVASVQRGDLMEARIDGLAPLSVRVV